MKNVSRYITIAVSLLIAGFLIYTFSDIVMWFVIAWILSMLGQPLMRFFQKYLRIGKFSVGKTGSALLTLLCFFIVILGVVSLFIPLVVQEAEALAKIDYEGMGKSLEGPVNQAKEWLAKRGITVDERSPEQMVRDTLVNVLNLGNITDFFGSSIAAVSNLLIAFFAIIFITFFFLQEQGMFVNFVSSLVPAQYEKQTCEVIEDISKMLTRYFGGVALQIFLIAVYVSILLSILGIKNAVLIGFFAALMNLIPYLGPTLGGALGVFIAVSTNLDADFYTVLLPITIKVVLVFWTVQLIDNYFLTPYIFSTTVKAHPLEIFIIIIMAAKIGGVMGMVLAIPAYTVIRVIAREFLSRFKIVQQFTKQLDEVFDEEENKPK